MPDLNIVTDKNDQISVVELTFGTEELKETLEHLGNHGGVAFEFVDTNEEGVNVIHVILRDETIGNEDDEET